MRDKYVEAELAILRGAQSYSVGGQQLTRANLAEIRKGRKEWEAEIVSLSGGLRTVRSVVFMDD